MNDEIKEILEDLDFSVNHTKDWVEPLGLNQDTWKILLDYITNLQTKNEYLETWNSEIKLQLDNLQQENENQAKRNSRQRLANQKQQELILKLQQENERLKVNCNLGYEELKVTRDYKSRCEKASEIIKKEKEIMGYAKYDSCLLLIEKILQNGSDRK